METDFYSLSRQNTGSHFLDSGGAYGRQWQKPMDKKNNLVRIEADKSSNSIEAWISLPGFLESVFTINKELNEAFYAMAESEQYKEEDWYTIFEAFVKAKGYTDEPDGYNSYNGD